jgi:hypothetical protein
VKLYNDPDNKYSGDLYDILKNKLEIFYDYCEKASLSPSQYHTAYSIMLKGRAKTFYYDMLARRSYTFEDMLALTKTHFETEENRLHYMKEWRDTTLHEIIRQETKKNSGKSVLDCLQMLFDKLQIVQRGLSEDYQRDNTLRDQVLSACRGVPECDLSMFKPASTFEGLCSDLRSAVGTRICEKELRESQHGQFHNYDKIYGRFEARIYGTKALGQFRDHVRDSCKPRLGHVCLGFYGLFHLYFICLLL